MNEAERQQLMKRKICPLLVVARAINRGEAPTGAQCMESACAWFREYSPITQAETGEKGRCAIHNI